MASSYKDIGRRRAGTDQMPFRVRSLYSRSEPLRRALKTRVLESKSEKENDRRTERKHSWEKQKKNVVNESGYFLKCARVYFYTKSNCMNAPFS